MDKDEIIAELRRVAARIGTPSLSRRQFKEHGQISVSTVESSFGSWNLAVEAAGLTPNSSGGGYPSRQSTLLSEDELLQEIVRLTKDIGRRPSERMFSAKGIFSLGPYRARWGSFGEACKAAYAKYGFPLAGEEAYSSMSSPQVPPSSDTNRPSKPANPPTHKPQQISPRKKVQYGEPMDFR